MLLLESPQVPHIQLYIKRKVKLLSQNFGGKFAMVHISGVLSAAKLIVIHMSLRSVSFGGKWHQLRSSLKTRGHCLLIPRADLESHDMQAAFSEVAILRNIQHAAVVARQSHFFILVLILLVCSVIRVVSWLVTYGLCIPLVLVPGFCLCQSHKRCTMPFSTFSTVTFRTHISTFECLYSHNLLLSL
jgi:hypothetical protein